jgi:hypothetical protein
MQFSSTLPSPHPSSVQIPPQHRSLQPRNGIITFLTVFILTLETVWSWLLGGCCGQLRRSTAHLFKTYLIATHVFFREYYWPVISFFYNHLGWDATVSVWYIGLHLAYCTSPGWCGTIGGLIYKRNEITSRKPAPVPLYPPQIPHFLTLEKYRPTAEGRQRLVAWAMERPINSLTPLIWALLQKPPVVQLLKKSPQKKSWKPRVTCCIHKNSALASILS